LNRDFFLRRKMDSEGFLPVTLISSFRRVQSLSTDVALITTAIKESQSLELVDDIKVRTRTDPTKWPINADVPLFLSGGAVVSSEFTPNGTVAPPKTADPGEADEPAADAPIVRPPVKSTILSAIPPPPLPRNFRAIPTPKVGELPPKTLQQTPPTSDVAQHPVLDDLNPNVPEFVPENLTRMKDVVSYESSVSGSKNVKAPAPLVSGESVGKEQGTGDEAPATLTAGE
jgi:la-related protein 1